MIKSSLIRRSFFAAVLLAAAQLANAGAVNKLRQFLDGTRTLRADFTQTVVARNGKKPQLSSGVMMFSRPGKFRWEVVKPYEQLLVGDGEKVWIFDPDLRQVTVRKVDAAIGATPAALLVGGDALEKNFKLGEAGTRDGLDWVEATPKSSDSGFEKLQLGFEGNELKAMQLQDNFGQTTSLSFTRIEHNPSIDATQFRFTPPAGVDVIGE
ncbi:MAG: outer membrane lipoprotein chaperone LolA [Propionivibrio sp.]